MSYIICNSLAGKSIGQFIEILNNRLEEPIAPEAFIFIVDGQITHYEGRMDILLSEGQKIDFIPIVEGG